MSLRTFLAAAAACAGIVVVTGSAHAFDRGRGDRSVAFYEEVRTPAAYATVERKVVVRPAYGRWENGGTLAVYGMRAERVVVEAAIVHRVGEPAVYAARMNGVPVRPARVHFEDVPAERHVVRAVPRLSAPSMSA